MCIILGIYTWQLKNREAVVTRAATINVNVNDYRNNSLLQLGVWTYTDLTVWFDYYYHLIDSIQFDITMHHGELTIHCILNFQFYFTGIQFCQ